MNKILKIVDLKKDYYTLQGEITAIENISLELEKGKFLSIVGSSGCGKSTLLNIIAGLDTQTSGTICYEPNLKIGYMLQDDALLPWLTVFQNAILGLKLQNMDTTSNTEYVKKLLTTYGLESFINKYPNELSGGMKQRVALIRTLATKPDLLLLDEPFSALDYQSRLMVSDDVYKIIKNENKTVIMITHDIAEAISLSDTIIVLSKRPAIIKKIYDINLSSKSTPINNRKCPEFAIYYDKIWRDLDVSI
ncbi:MAG: ABC transporter ATP-binding protein [Firmicutes bacterium]|nr:ABC transporter ATP-binding protein [Bacillota bacterium]